MIANTTVPWVGKLEVLFAVSDSRRLRMRSIITIILIILLLVAPVSASIAIIEYDGNVVESGEDISVLTCDVVELHGRSSPPGADLMWYLDGVPQTSNDQFSFTATWGRHNVILVAGEHSNTLTIYGTENRKPVLERVKVVTGIDKGEEEETYDEEEVEEKAIYVKTATGSPVELIRNYDNDDELFSEVAGNLEDVTILNECKKEKCSTTLNFSETGTYPIVTKDTDICGESVSVSFKIEVFRNNPPIMEIGGNFEGTDVSGVSLWSESYDDDPEDEIAESWWIDRGKKIKGSKKTFKGDGGTVRDVTLFGTDRYGATKNVSITIWFYDTKNDAPKANFSGTPKMVTVNQTFVLDASNSWDDHGFARANPYIWEIFAVIDEKEILYEEAIKTSKEKLNHSIGTPGEFIIYLTVTDDGVFSKDGFSESDTDSFELTVVEEVKETTNTGIGTNEGAGIDERTKPAEKNRISLTKVVLTIIAVVLVIIVILLIAFRRTKKPRKI